MGSLHAAPSPPPIRVEFTEVHMGLPVRLVLYAPGEVPARAAARAAFDRVRALDAMMSDYRPDSELERVNAAAGAWVPVSPELLAVLGRAREVAEATGGAFDPTVGPVVALWREARRSGRPPAPDALALAGERVGWRGLELDPARGAVRLARPGMRLDLGGIAKGFILQEAVETLRARGAPRALAEAGGDVVAGEAPPGREGWCVAVAGVPAAFAARAARLRRAALATSGGTSQFLEVDGVRYSHVVDPATAVGVAGDAVAHVIAGDGATADALATALGVAGESALARFPGVVGARISGATPDVGDIGCGTRYPLSVS